MSPTAPSPAPPAEAPKSSFAQIRMLVMLGLFLLVLIVGVWDYLLAQPAALAANKKLQDYVDSEMKKGVKSSEGAATKPTVITQEVVHSQLQRKPSSTFEESTYTIETYWYGGMPNRNYLKVIYEGPKDKRRYSSHLHDVSPEPADLPLTEAEMKANAESAKNAKPLPNPTSRESGAPPVEGAAGSGDEKPVPAETKAKDADKPAGE